MKTLPIHIGTHKTGSTFLQKFVFPVMFPDWSGNRGEEWNLIRSKIASHIALDDAERADELSKQYLLESRHTHGPGEFISSESLSGRQKCNYPGESVARFNGFLDAVKCIQGSREVKVTIFFRKHLSFLQSAWLHQHRLGSFRSWGDFVSGFSHLDLSWTYRAQQLLKANVDCRIYNYEDFRSYPSSVIMDLAHYFEIDLERETVKQILSTPRKNGAPETILAQNLCRFSNVLALMLNKSRIPVGAGSFPEGITRKADRFSKKMGGGAINKARESLFLPETLEKKFEADWEALQPYFVGPEQYPTL